MRWGAGAALLVFLAMSGAVPALAVPVVGRVTGVQPEAVGKLTVTATHLRTGQQSVAIGDAFGGFRIPDLPEGDAILVVSSTDAPGPLAARVVHIPAGGLPNVVLSLPRQLAPTFNFLLYKGEYYNNSPTGPGDNVSVTAPSATNNINFGLATGGGTISGRVTNADGTVGVPGLIVFAFGINSSVISFDRSDATGHYKITGIPADSFYVGAGVFLSFTPTDYVGEYYNNATSVLDAATVPVTDGADTPNINFFLDLGGTMTGRVTASQGGAGIAGAEVSASLPPPSFAAASTVTDASGNFTLRGLRANNQPGYKVRAEADGYVAEYYDHKPDATTATPVTITAGGTTQNINFGLAAGATIRGKATLTGSDTPLGDVLISVENITGTSTYYGFTDELGNYEVTSLPADQYRIHAPDLNQWWDHVDNVEASTAITLAAGELRTGIDFSGLPNVGGCQQKIPTSVGGTVTAESGGAPVVGAAVSLWFDGGEFGRYQFDQVETDGSGNYVFECVDEGDYFILAEAPDQTFIAEWYNNGAGSDSAGAVAQHVTSGSSLSNKNFALTAGGSIKGTVTADGSNAPLSFVGVNAMNVTTHELFSTITLANGTYTIDSGESGGLRTGNYKVWVDSHSTADISLVPVILSRFEASPGEDGIAVEWAVEGDDVSGFNVYRGDDLEVEPARLTARPLDSSATRFVDGTARPGVDASYWIGIIDREGKEERFGPASVRRGDVPVLTRLFNPRPNPARERSEIAFSLAQPGHVTVRIHDLSGRLVRTLYDGERSAGNTRLVWDGKGDDGAAAPQGMYYVRFLSGNVVETEKLVLTH